MTQRVQKSKVPAREDCRINTMVWGVGVPVVPRGTQDNKEEYEKGGRMREKGS